MKSDDCVCECARTFCLPLCNYNLQFCTLICRAIFFSLSHISNEVVAIFVYFSFNYCRQLVPLRRNSLPYKSDIIATGKLHFFPLIRFASPLLLPMHSVWRIWWRTNTHEWSGEEVFCLSLFVAVIWYEKYFCARNHFEQVEAFNLVSYVVFHALFSRG